MRLVLQCRLSRPVVSPGVTVDWGTVPAWISAAGVLFTAGTAAMAYRTFQHALEDRRADQERQARLVTSEISGLGGVMVHITNRSDEPITELVVEAVTLGANPSAKARPNRTVGSLHHSSWALLESETEARFAVEFVDRDGQVIEFMDMIEDVDTVSCTIQFTDRVGRRWRRMDLERPRRVYN